MSATRPRSTRRTPPGAPEPPAGGPAGGAGERGARRVAAAALDASLVPLVVLGGAELAWRAGWLAAGGVGEAGWVTWSRSYPQVAWTVVAAAFAYHGLCTARWGRTPGKRLLGLVVVPARAHRGDGGRGAGAGARGGVPVTASLWRAAWSAAVYAPAPLAPVLVVAGWVSLQGGQRRSLADHAAGTRVVRAAPEATGAPAGRR